MEMSFSVNRINARHANELSLIGDIVETENSWDCIRFHAEEK